MPASFVYPIKELESDRIKLVPFRASEHVPAVVEGIQLNPELVSWLPYGPFHSADDYVTSYLTPRILEDPNSFLFAIITKVALLDRPNADANSFAGVIGLLNAQPSNGACEIGYITILTRFQRSFVTTHAVGLLLHYLLDLPRLGGGLGLRRVAWQAHAENKKSVAAAKRLGFHFEGIARWQRTYPVGKEGSQVIEGTRTTEEWEGVRDKLGRHTAMLSICWDDWEKGGVREHVNALMER